MATSLRDNVLASSRLPRDADLLASRAELLKPADRDLLRAVLIRGSTAAEIARIPAAKTTTRRVRGPV